MSETLKYPAIIRAVQSTPWAILPEKLSAIIELVSLRAAGGRFSAEEIEARIGAAAPSRQQAQTGTVAILPLTGVITPRINMMSEMSGGTSAQQFSAMFQAAVDNPEIGAILIDVDSPGGSTDLVPELAAQIRDARGSKPITAIANTDAASAAYWIASQADEFVVTPSGMVGSIGVFAAHDDLSAQLEQDGVKTTLISAGKFKTEASPYEPLSEEAKAAIQARVDDFYGMFVADVAAGRGVPASSVTGGFGEGRIVTAQAAVKAGMVDRVATFEATVEEMIGRALAAGSGGRARARAQGGVIGAAAGVGVHIFPGDLVLNQTQQTALLAGLEAPPGAEDTTQHDTEATPPGGLSFVGEAYAVRDAADRFVENARSLAVLAEVRNGRLTAAKRDGISAVAESLRASATELESLVAQSVPADTTGRDTLRRAQFDEIRRAHLMNGVAG